MNNNLLGSTALLTMATFNLVAMDPFSLPPIPTAPSLRHPAGLSQKSTPKPTKRTMRQQVATPKIKTSPRKPIHYSFGSVAAQSIDEAVDRGLFKNEHPHKSGVPLINSLEEGHCVIVARSDQRFTYGIITEVLNPNMVCVACGPDKKDQEDYTIKIIATSQLYLKPDWLSNAQKDVTTLTRYTRVTKGLPSIPETLKEDSSYKHLPNKLAAQTKK